ncbi:hypothetical protein ACQKEY_07235 [Lysinibacillus fusiformis]|uniref:hypothetical protein n=1 Tax=Lysinibacillus fusiformis TaxID=28031 RepID=UPI003CFDB47E
MGNINLEDIILLEKDQKFVENLLIFFGAKENKRTILGEQYIKNINIYKRLSEYKKNTVKARLNYIIDNNTPLPYLVPLITAFIAIVNLIPLILFGEVDVDKTLQYFITFFINCFVLLYLLIPYRKEKKIIAKSKYLLNLINI